MSQWKQQLMSAECMWFDKDLKLEGYIVLLKMTVFTQN